MIFEYIKAAKFFSEYCFEIKDMKKKPGRPPSPYQTTTIAFRVRVEHADAIRQAVKELQRKLIETQLQK